MRLEEALPSLREGKTIRCFIDDETGYMNLRLSDDGTDVIHFFRLDDGTIVENDDNKVLISNDWEVVG